MFKWFKTRIGGKKGFTLIELIVVIAIIVVLMALLVPMMSKYIKNATDTTNLANARAVYSAAAAWGADQLANGGTIAENQVLTHTSKELDDYFNNASKKTYTVQMKSDGSVVAATYAGVTYPTPPATSPATS